MKKILSLILCLFLLSCKKENTETVAAATIAQSEKKNETQDYPIKADTIKIYSGDDFSKSDFILANLLKKDIAKDSVITAYFRLDFYNNSQKKFSVDIVSDHYQEGSEWTAVYGLNDKNQDASFLQISFGYAACGYIQMHSLYYLSNNSIELLHNWDTVSDSGWGTWLEFLSSDSNSVPVFYSRTISFSPQDDDEEIGVVEYSDSIRFEKTNNKWRKTRLTKKDYVYRKKSESFAEFNNVEE